MPQESSGDGRLLLSEIHAFRERGRDFLLSLPGCAFWQVDGATARIVAELAAERGRSCTRRELVTRFERRFGDRQVEEILDELARTGVLREEGREPEEAGRPARFPRSPLQIGSLVCHVSHDCNMRCAYCYGDSGAYGGPRELMSEEMARRYVDLLFGHSGRLERLHMTFFGGEPLINLPAIRAAVLHGEQLAGETGKKITFSATTNGTLLTPEIVRFLDEHRIGISLSIDGPEEVHDAVRVYHGGGGTYQRVREAAALFNGSRPLGARVTLTRRFLKVSEIVEHLLGLGFSEVGVSPVNCADPRWDLADADLEFFHEECRRVGEIYLEKALGGGYYGFTNLSNLLRQLHSGEDKAYPCGAGIQLYAGDPSGKLFMCHRLVGREPYQVGDVEQGIDPRRRADFLRRVNLENKEGCAGCWARYLCSGGCYYVSELHYGDPGRTYPLYCRWLGKWYEYGIGLYAELSERRPQFLESVLEPRLIC